MNECDSMDSLMFYCPQYSISAIFEKHLTHKQTNGLMVKASYRDAWMPLKSTTGNGSFSPHADFNHKFLAQEGVTLIKGGQWNI